jgi:hypothetical protein
MAGCKIRQSVRRLYRQGARYSPLLWFGTLRRGIETHYRRAWDTLGQDAMLERRSSIVNRCCKLP